MAKSKRVTTPIRTATMVRFRLGSECCALPIGSVHQVIRDTPITRVPNVAEHVEGVINLRGLVVPIVDLKYQLGLGVRTRSERLRLLIVESGGRRVGFSVDAVEGVVQIQEGLLQPAPEVVLAKLSGRFVTGVVTTSDAIVVVLDLEELLATKERARGPRRFTRTTGSVNDADQASAGVSQPH